MNPPSDEELNIKVPRQNKTKSLNLEDLKIKSFITISSDAQKSIKGMGTFDRLCVSNSKAICIDPS